MASLSLRTAGESHGPALTCLVEGMPSGLRVDLDFINAELARRQGGYGRGARQRIEQDAATFLAGVRNGETTGAPIVISIPNRDSRLDDEVKTPTVHRPRPGHADLAGSIKWLTTDARNTLERASARETAARTAGGALARVFLRAIGIDVFGFVRGMLDTVAAVEVTESNWKHLRSRRDASEVACPDEHASKRIVEHIHHAKVEKDTVGGFLEVHVFGCPIGLGSCAQWDLKLDGRLAQAVMSIQAIKAVEIGLGRECGTRSGSRVHDPIAHDARRAAGGAPDLGYIRSSNNAGGIEGGMTNGMPVVVRATMKPISTLLRGLPSVNMATKQPEHSDYERSDVCALPAASVVAENVVGFEIARAFLDKFGGDSMIETLAHYRATLDLARNLPLDANCRAEAAREDGTET
jgi:chorismate synthase